jgi:hypothetical protein
LILTDSVAGIGGGNSTEWRLSAGDPTSISTLYIHPPSQGSRWMPESQLARHPTRLGDGSPLIRNFGTPRRRCCRSSGGCGGIAIDVGLLGECTSTLLQVSGCRASRWEGRQGRRGVSPAGPPGRTSFSGLPALNSVLPGEAPN